MRPYILTISAFLMLSASLSAQVTVGSNHPPEEAAILDMKSLKVEDSNPLAPTTDKDGGGLLIPRVQLSSKTDLYFTDNSIPEEMIRKLRYTGLVVYNIGPTSDKLGAGVCVWDGSQWKEFTAALPQAQEAWSLTGNSGTNALTNYIGTQENTALSIRTNKLDRIYITGTGNVGIGTKSPLATLHVNGNMILTRADILSNNPKVLVINDEGQVGTAASIPAKLMFAESATEQRMTQANRTALDNGNEVIVTWASGDISTNNLMTINSDNTFTFRENALCEISGYIIYQPYATPPTSFYTAFQNSGAALNVIIQYRKGGGAWTDFTAARVIWVGGAVKDVAKTVNVPPGIDSFNAGDQIRMIIKRPAATFGLYHHTAGLGGIFANTTSKVKGLKIIAM